MEFKRKAAERQSPNTIVNLEAAIYEQLEIIAYTENCTLKEAASRLLEAGIAVYHQGKEQVASDE